MKSSAYPPLDGLLDLACRDGVDVRPTLLRVLTDLYVQKPVHSSDEVTQYVELVLGLIDTVDDTTRTAVAASLSNYPTAPAAVLARLGVSPVTTLTALPDIDFAATAVTDVAAHAQAEFATETGLVDLFFESNSEDRRLILLYLDAGAAPRTAPAVAPASNDVIKRLENAALQRNTTEVSRVLEQALNIPRTLAERVARDATGEPFVIAAKALGMKAAVLQRVLLFLNPSVGQSVQRVYDLADLFDEMTREAAEHMLSIWRSEGAATKPAHQPVYGADGSRDGRTQAAQPATRENAEPVRIKSAS